MLANTLGANWLEPGTSVWHIENGKLCGQGAHNLPAWLQKVTVVVPTRKGIGRRMMAPASRCQKLPSPRARRSISERGMNRQRFTRVPMSESSAGRSVADAAIETSGIIRPPMPIDRMNGSGMSTSSANPSATVMPENSVARPAVDIARSRASSGSPRASSSSRKRKTTSIE